MERLFNLQFNFQFKINFVNLHFLVLVSFFLFGKIIKAQTPVLSNTLQVTSDKIANQKNSFFANNSDSCIVLQLVNDAVKKTEIYLDNNLYINPDYPIFFC